MGIPRNKHSLIMGRPGWSGWIAAGLFAIGAIVAVASDIEKHPACAPITVRYEAREAGRGMRDAGRWGAVIVHVCGVVPLTRVPVVIRYELDVRLTPVVP